MSVYTEPVAGTPWQLGTRLTQVPPAVAAPPVVPPVTAPAMLPGNLLSPADSDFELGATGHWVPLANCTVTVVNPAEHSFSGSGALKVVATAAGTVKFGVNTAFPLGALRGVAWSLYIFTLSAGHVVTAAPWWYTAGGVFINFAPASLGTTGPAGTWIPNTGNAASVATTGQAKFFVTVTGMGAGEALWCDLVFVAVPQFQVLADWPDEPSGVFSDSYASLYTDTYGATAQPRFCDLTPFTRRDTPAALTRGRQDNISDVQAGQASMLLADDAGWLTPLNTGSPFYPNVKIGRRLQVNVPDEVGAWHTRFDGQVTELALNPATTGLQMDTPLTASDVLAFLNRQTALDSWTKREILLDNPTYHWTLDDPAGSSVAAETSGNGGPSLQLRQWGTGGTYAFAGGTAVTAGVQQGMETATWQYIGTPAGFPSVYFAQSHAGAAKTSQANWQLQAPLPSPVATTAGTSTTIECFLMADIPNSLVYTNVAPYTFWAFTLGNSRTGAILGVQVVGGASPTVRAAFCPQWPDTPVPPLVTSPTVAFQPGLSGPAPAVLVISGTTVSFWYNANLIGTLTLPAGTAFNWISAGGPLGGYEGWLGQLSCLSVFPGALPSSRIAAHSFAGKSGKYNVLVGSLINNLAQYTGMPAQWNNLPYESLNGLANVDYFSLQGVSAYQAMQQAALADGGLLYVDAAGRLNYAGREVRMGAGGPVLTLQSGQYEADMGDKVNDQYLVNAAAYSSAGITTGVAAQNNQSILDYGNYNAGTAASPTTISALTYNGWFQHALNAAGATIQAFQPDNLTWAAQWAANIKAQPAPKLASLRIDLLTVEGLAISTALALEINQVIAVAGLPVQFPNTPHANEFFIEGISETVGLGVHDLILYVSPASQGRAWIPGDPNYGVLDSTAVIGISAPPAPAVVPNGEFSGTIYPGPPYYPPAYVPAMNKTGFAGALDQAGIWANLQQQLQPPLAVIAQGVNNQSVANNTATQIVLDSIYIDSLGGTGWLNGFPNWYFVLVPGWYQLYGTVEYASNSAGRRFAWFEVSQGALTSGTGPTGANTNFIATASVMPPSTANVATAQCSAKLYCTLGTAISLFTKQTSGGALNTGTTRGGSMLGIRFLGDTATED